MGAYLTTQPSCENLQRDGPLSVTQGIPYRFGYYNRNFTFVGGSAELEEARFWIHWALVILGFIFSFVTFFAQLKRPARYGRHDKGHGKLYVPMLVAVIASDFVPGVLFFTALYFGQGRNISQPVNLVFYCLFTIHYIHRGLINPVYSLFGRYCSAKMPLFYPLVTFVANLLYHYLNADFIGAACYLPGYYYDPRFIIGVVLFIAGFVINVSHDVYIAVLRIWKQRKDDSKEAVEGDNGRQYYLPQCCLYKVVMNPNYVGEGLEWLGWTIGTWSLSGLVWWMFVMATFIPRARHNLKWYKRHFDDFPKYRGGLIPLIY
jgi:protein-S-isoprenylcysteine O-methyltransferase Ste14